MTDDATDELLSRYLDDDLDAAERQRCAERLAAEPELRAALAALEQTRAAVGRLASAMAPPAALDTLLEPLRRGRSGPRPGRSLMVLLSAAACLVIGVAVVRDLRREPAAAHGPSQPPQVAVGPGAGERYYQMKALPTAAPDAQLRGAADRLLASPAPAIAVPAAPSEPLQVYGPLSEEEHARETALLRSEERGTHDELRQTDARALAAAPKAEVAGARPAAPSGDAATSGCRAQAPSRHLALQVNGAVVGERAGLPPAMPAGSFSVAVVVRDGRVVSCATAVGAGDPLNDMVCAAVASLQLRGVADGARDGVVVISTGSP